MRNELDQELTGLIREARRDNRLAFAEGKRLRAVLARRVARDRLVEPLDGLFETCEDWHKLTPTRQATLIVRGAAHAHPGWAFCDVSAALVWGIDVPYDLLGELHVAMSRWNPKRKHPGIRLHCVDGEDYVEANGVRVTSAARTVVDCARRVGIPLGTVVADSALNRGILSEEALWKKVDSMRGSRGIARAREAVLLADGRAESGGETLARLAILRLGYMVPDLQVSVVSPVDGSRYRVDFRWILPDGRQVFGEFDGHDKYVNPDIVQKSTPEDVLEAERIRESYLTALGAPVMRMKYADVMSDIRMKRLLDAFGIPKV